MARKFLILGAFVTATATLALVGCNKTQPPADSGKKDDHNHKVDAGKKDDHDHPPGAAKKDDHDHPPGGAAKKDDHDHPPGAKKDDHDHEHKPGAHGGMIVSLGRDSYHAEVVFEKGRKIRLYVLGKEETKSQELNVQDLSGFVTLEGATEAVPVTFKPDPQATDGKGKTSQFVATLPENMAGKKVKVTINNITIGTDKFRIEFSHEVVAHTAPVMPRKTTT